MKFKDCFRSAAYKIWPLNETKFTWDSHQGVAFYKLWKIGKRKKNNKIKPIKIINRENLKKSLENKVVFIKTENYTKIVSFWEGIKNSIGPGWDSIFRFIALSLIVIGINLVEDKILYLMSKHCGVLRVSITLHIFNTIIGHLTQIGYKSFEYINIGRRYIIYRISHIIHSHTQTVILKCTQ